MEFQLDSRLLLLLNLGTTMELWLPKFSGANRKLYDFCYIRYMAWSVLLYSFIRCHIWVSERKWNYDSSLWGSEMFVVFGFLSLESFWTNNGWLHRGMSLDKSWSNNQLTLWEMRFNNCSGRNDISQSSSFFIIIKVLTNNQNMANTQRTPNFEPISQGSEDSIIIRGFPNDQGTAW